MNSQDLIELIKISSSEFLKPWLKNRIQEILVQYPHTKDNDEALSVIIWETQLQIFKDKEAPGFAINFFYLYSRKLLASSEAICRQRRLLQEKNPALRGTTWDARHAKSEQIKIDLYNDKVILMPEEADNE